MLSYKAPFLEVGNLTIFRDDTNADVFYYICLQPSIIMDDNGRPNIEAYAILPESGVGLASESIVEASLMLDISLAATPEELELGEEAIKDKFGKKPKLLSPAPIHSGKVFLIVAQAGEKPDPKTWFLTSEVKPSLFGNNRASLVVRATGENAKLLIAALDSDVIAASVHYDLEMLGIAPVFKASLKADWKKIYHHFEDVENTNFIFYNDQVSKTIDDLAETSAIEISIEELDPDVKSEAMKSLLNELKSEVVKKLFQPASSPLSASQKTEDRIANGAARILSSIMPGAHYIQREIDESQLSTFTVDLNQKNVKKYPFNPQALLSSMIRKVGGISDRIKWIKLDEIPFFDQRVEIRLSGDTFKGSNIKSVVVDCRVVNENENKIVTQQSIVFDNDDMLQNHLNFTREKDKNYRYDYRVTMFMSTDSNKLPNKLELDWKNVESPYIYFNAAEYFETYDLSINIDDTSVFDHTHLIQADVLISDKTDQQQILLRSFLFSNSDKEHKVLSLVANRTVSLQFDVTTTYFISESKEHKATIEDVKGQFYFIPNPFENKWSVDLICNADWEKNNKIILETRIKDAERTDLIFNKFDFRADATENKLSVATSLDTIKESFEYRTTVLTKDANIIQGPWNRHEGPILVISDKIKFRKNNTRQTSRSTQFEDKEIKKVAIEFKYETKPTKLTSSASK
jgi:hypothetical protein